MSKSYRIKAYVKYRRKARGRHGTHSPFVYAFIEEGLKKENTNANLTLATSRHRRLVNKVINYFACSNIAWLTNADGEQESYVQLSRSSADKLQLRTAKFLYSEYDQYPSPDLLLIDMPEPSAWKTAYDKYRHRLSANSIVLIIGIHHSSQHAVAWEEIHTQDGVLLSIDLFKIGLLFFREEFKEKQHFVVKS